MENAYIKCPFLHNSTGITVDPPVHPEDFPCNYVYTYILGKEVEPEGKLDEVSVERCLQWTARKAAAAYLSPVKKAAYDPGD